MPRPITDMLVPALLRPAVVGSFVGAARGNDGAKPAQDLGMPELRAERGRQGTETPPKDALKETIRNAETQYP